MDGWMEREREREREGGRDGGTDRQTDRQTKVGNRPVNMHIDQTTGHYWF